MQAQISLRRPAFQRQGPVPMPTIKPWVAQLYERCAEMGQEWLSRHHAAHAHHRTVEILARLSEQMLKDAAISQDLRADVCSYQTMLRARALRDLGALTRR